MRVRVPAPTRLARAVLVGASVWGGAGVCAAASCPVEFRGVPSEAWLGAGRAIEALTMDPGDCARIELELEQSTDAARLTFVTRDGRRAERRLTHPDELMPTVVALGVRGPTETSTPQVEDRPMGPARTADAVSPLDSAPSVPSAGPREARALFALLGGARAGTGRLVSPVIGGAAAIALDRWELGLHLAIELQYFDLRLSEPDGPSSAASVGVTVGRREPIADVELLFGARSMVAAVNDESVKDSGERGRAELRVGAYLGGVWPRARSPRFRADLALDVVPHGSLGSIGTRVTPWLAVSALVGVEFRGP
ncbi:MAG: hypothetical protein K0R38_6715 [Polyangiaceae bacterium]|nr:hypothetical protein [Polyangiaceae bacterium]